MTNWPNYGKWRHGKKRKELLETNIFTYPEKVPEEILNPIMEDVARQVANWENAKKMDYKERYDQIVDVAYDNYQTEWMKENPPFAGPYTNPCLTQEQFINKCKTDNEFSEKWGLQIEERELTPKERIELAGGRIQDKYPALVEMSLNVCDERDIPTKLITLTYNNETIESYE